MAKDRTEYFKAYHKKTKVRKARKARIKYQENESDIKTKRADYYNKNKEKWSEYGKAYRKANKELVNEKQRRYRERLKKNIQPRKDNGLKSYRKRIADLEDVCKMYWIVRERAAITFYKKNKYTLLIDDFKEIQRMKKAA